jgi:hypothetical protein
MQLADAADEKAAVRVSDYLYVHLLIFVEPRYLSWG